MLHEDRVWEATLAVATGAARRREFHTFFVHPFWPRRAGVDITGRVQTLADLGHEIGQHTHYYTEIQADGTKLSDHGDDTVTRRLDEDHRWLEAAGFSPKGFVSGAWDKPPAQPAWLDANGFDYDCTTRAYRPTAGVPSSPGTLHGDVLRLPTTAPLSAAARGALRPHPPVLRAGNVEYQLLYFHDDDLLLRTKRLALRATVRLMRSRGFHIERADRVAAAVKESTTVAVSGS